MRQQNAACDVNQETLKSWRLSSVKKEKKKSSFTSDCYEDPDTGESSAE